MPKEIKKEILYFYEGKVDELHYCIIEYRGIDTIEIINDLLTDMGILFLSLDSDKLTGRKIKEYEEILNKNRVPVTVETDNLWLDKKDAHTFLHAKRPIIQGNELIFSPDPFLNTILPLSKPLKGVENNKLREQAITYLKSTLRDTDLYVNDDFTESLFVTKNKEIFNSVKNNVDLFIQSTNQT